MKLRTVRHLWGVEEAWETAFPKFKELGYYAIESPLCEFAEGDRARLKKLITENGLQFVNQIHTDSYHPGKRSKDVKHHLERFRNQVAMAKEFGAIFCNSHSGYDGWSSHEKEEFFAECIKIEKESGMTVCHETHRRRIFYNPWDTRDILLKFPDLKITADLSHWFCVLSNDLEGEMDIIKLIAKNTILIHARVGYDNGPQVSDPRAPENQTWVEAHERCWDIMWRAQAANGLEFSYIEPEFGPPSYMQTQPYTKMPVVNLWEICEWQTKRQIQRFQNFNW